MYVSPSLNITAFNCPSCNAYCRQYWYDLRYHNGSSYAMVSNAKLAVCEHCNGNSFWLYNDMIHPNIITVSLPNPDLPDDIKADYMEARDILTKSPKGAAALIRLAIQKLCVHLGGTGRNINDDISKLVKDGLPAKVQKALDIVRVVGNNAVHPGTIDLNDNRDLAMSLFGLINIIADVMITQPKQVDELYGGLPANLLEAIEKRDSK